jgi:hypothetical protein
MSGYILECARAEALFVSDVQRSERRTCAELRAAIQNMVRRHGTRGCAALVAQAFGEYPEIAAGRMSWALDAVRAAYAQDHARQRAA